jgi:hypothetical protein
MRKRSFVPMTDAEVAVDACESKRALRTLKLSYSYIQLRAAYETECMVADSMIAQARSIVEALVQFAHKHGVDGEPEATQMRAAIAAHENA